MNRSQRDEELFGDVIARPADERAAFLAQACGNDAAMLARIWGLVAAHESQASLMSDVPSARHVAVEETAGDAIGRYKLLQQIGEGGCGVVWMAEQEEPVRRRVALKIIKLGMDTKAVVARFEAERQALAMMDHPNIAKVHDAGATDTGRPFFVMELVRGIPITKYCDENHLTPKDRLELFIKVCHAVQHAHQKGIIHRDLKPSNILVTVNDGAPTPKVIDFGIAKATQGKLTDATVFTALEQFIGTPVYMSPEQAEMSSLDVDTRSDIYSLGVLLYELLTGRPPFDPKKFAQAGVDQIRQQIREVEPPRPSARLSTLDADERTTIAKLRGTAASNLSIILRGDLDWIVMRCIEKDRTRRYDTANGLAMDIQRYLRNEPVVARPPSTAYLLQKLIRRHRVAVIAISAVGTVVVIGGSMSAWQAIRATRAKHDAAIARLKAEDLLSFVFTDLGEQLEDLGQLPILGQVSARSVAYYEGLPPALQTRETRASHAFSVAIAGYVLGMRGDTPAGRAQLEEAFRRFEDLARTGPLTPFMRVAHGFAAGELARQSLRDVLNRAELPAICDRGEAMLKPVLDDAQWGGWAHRIMVRLLRAKAHSNSGGSTAGTWTVLVSTTQIEQAVRDLERAIESAQQADRRLPNTPHPGLRAAETMADLSVALFRAHRRTEAWVVNARARETLRGFLEHAPTLASARLAHANALRAAAEAAFTEWDFPRGVSAMRDAQTELAYLRRVDPRAVEPLILLAMSWSSGGGSHFAQAGQSGSGRRFNEFGLFRVEWTFGNFAEAKASAKRGIELLSTDVTTPAMRAHLLGAHVNCARVCAAAGQDTEADQQLAAADAVLARVREERRLVGTNVLGNWLIGRNFHRLIEFEKLNWSGMRQNAAEAIARIEADAPALESSATLQSHRANAHRDFMRAAFEMGDYAAARRAMGAWPRDTEVLPPGAVIQARFDYLGNELTRVHALARAGETDVARRQLGRIWPEIEQVLGAGPDHLFNQVQTARALSIRAEIDGLPAEKRTWLERAVGWLRPALVDGKLTRYERDVLLAGIEKQLAALPAAERP